VSVSGVRSSWWMFAVKRDFAALEYNADYDKAVIEGRILSGDDNVTDLHSA